VDKVTKFEQLCLYLRKLNLACWGLGLFTFYVLTQRWFELYLQSRFLEVFVSGAALLLILIGQHKLILQRSRITMIDILWFIGITVIMINILRVGVADYARDIFIYSFGFALIFLAKVDISAFRLSFMVIKGAAVIYALGSLLQFFFTAGFNNFLFNFTTTYSQESIIRHVESNYYPGFGFGRKSVAVGAISAGLGLIVSFWDFSRDRLLNYNYLLVIILLAGLLVTGKLSILVWVLFALLLVYILSGSHWTIKVRALQGFGLLLGCLLLLIVITQFIGASSFLARLSDFIGTLMAFEVPESVDQRLIQYRDAWAIFLEYPIFGVGWKQFEVLTAGFYPDQFDVHNLYLQLLVEMGVVGFFAVITPLAYTYLKTIQAISTKKKVLSSDESLWKKGLTFSFFFQSLFFLYSMTESILKDINYIMLYFIVIAITNSYLALNQQDRFGPGQAQGQVQGQAGGESYE